eukprot:g81357.t1
MLRLHQLMQLMEEGHFHERKTELHKNAKNVDMSNRNREKTFCQAKTQVTSTVTFRSTNDVLQQKNKCGVLAMAKDWELSTCCSEMQGIFIGVVAATMALMIFLWNSAVMLPFKLLTTFLHELGHASAVWMTCGSVEGISVETNQGGLTTYRGGKWWLVMPAGYLGSSFWGAAILIMAVASSTTALIIAIILGLALLIVMIVYAANCTVRLVCLLFIAILVGALCVDFLALEDAEWKLTPILLVFLGTLNGSYAVRDIWDDTISRTEPASDAYKFAQKTHTSARCCGVIWGAISLCFLGGSIYISLVLLTGQDLPDG